MKRPTVVVGKRLIYDVRVIVSVIAAVLLLVAVVSYELGLNQAGYNRMRTVQVQGELRRANKKLQDDNKRLSERVAILDTAMAVDRETYRQVELELAELQNRILDQQEDLEFYRGIVDEGDGSGLRIQAFSISEGLREDEFDLRVVLAQALRSSREVSGSVELTVEGTRDGEPIRLRLRDIALEGDQRRIAYSFRYFQDLKVPVRLPAGFSPDRVRVLVRPGGKSAKTVEEFFVWRVESG